MAGRRSILASPSSFQQFDLQRIPGTDAEHITEHLRQHETVLWQCDRAIRAVDNSSQPRLLG